MIKLGNWVGEHTTTVGAGAIVMVGRLDGFASFSILGDGEVYYTIQDGIAKETGIGTLTGNVMERNKVSATIDSVGNYSTENTPIYLSGNAHVFCTANADFMAHLHNGIDTVDASALKALQSAEAAELSKQQAELAAQAADSSKVAAAVSESKVAQSVAGAAASATSALASKNAAETSESNAASSSTKSANSATASEVSAVNAKKSETNAQSAATAAAVSESSANASATSAAGSATAAKQSKDEAEEIVNTIGTSVADAAASAEAAQRYEVAAQSAAGSAQDSAAVAQLSEVGAVAAKDKAQEKADEFKSYIIFLNDIAEWMTATGQVEIELPNGQKVTLDSIKALNDAISKIPKVVQEPGESKTDVMSQDGTVKAINAAKPGDATTTSKGIVQLSSSVGVSTTTVPHEKAVSDFIGLMMTADSGILTLKSPGGTNQLNLNDNGMMTGSGWSFNGGGVLNASGGIFRTNTNSTSIDLIKGDERTLRIETAPHAGSRIMLRFYYINTDNAVQHTLEFPYANGEVAIIGGNSSFDGNGFLRKTSPVIQIHADGTFDTNDESEGAEVRRTGTGQYHITGILGYNSDGAWGVNGGISVPKDNNSLELVYVDDRVQSDGSLIIETCHRQHTHLPERFQNWRLKDVTPEGERIFYQDGEPCDLPESTRLDVRVEMPQGSVWNVKQRELAEQMERPVSGYKSSPESLGD